MNLYFVDIESYYDKQCNIKKLGVSQYINHPDFEFLTVGYKTPRMKRARVLHGAQIDKFFADLDPAETTFVAHNMYFDGYAIARHYDFVPHFMMCTYAMAQPVHSQYRPTSLDVLAEHYGLGRKIENALGKMEGKRRPDLTAEEYRILVEYNERDVELGEGIFNRMIKSFPREELDIIDLTLRMFIEPMLEVDGKRAQAIIEEERQAKVDACAAAGITEAEARSDLVLRGILEERGYECPMKWSAKQSKEIPALAQSDLPFQAMRDSDDAALAALAKARTACKSTINETRAQAILDRAGRPFPVYLLYCAAHTMRWGGGDKVNPQNMPRDGRLRSCLVAPPGYKLVIVDAAQIEARMLAWFAGQEDLVAAFARGDDVYSLFASVLYNRPVNKADNPDLRFVGKTCLAANTLVLTKRGWIKIVDVEQTDQVWDGVEWVNHQGVLCAGVKPTIKLSGVEMTPDHEILVGGSSRWMEARHVLENPTAFQLALSLATLPSSVIWSTLQEQESIGAGDHCVDVEDVGQSTLTPTVTCERADQQHAMIVGKSKPAPSATGNTVMQWLTMSTEQDYSIDSPLQSAGATTLNVEPTFIMENAVSKFVLNGEKSAQRSFSMFKRLRVGMYQSLKWIASMLTGTTNRVTSGSAQDQTTLATSEESKTSKPVYDILNAGVRKRFAILTDSGPLIVHNSILGLGYQCGAAKFQLIMETGMMGPPVEFTIEEAQSTVNTYRTTYPMIKQTWHELQKMIVNLMPSSKPVEFRGLIFKPGEVVMPNGLSLHYPNIDFHVGQYDSAEFGYHPYDRRFKKNIPKKLYGGVITENIIQSLARTATTHHMMEINKYYPVVMMAHDEVVMCVPDRIADECLRYAIDVMAVPPDWAKGCPLEGEGGIHNHYVK